MICDNNAGRISLSREVCNPSHSSDHVNAVKWYTETVNKDMRWIQKSEYTKACITHNINWIQWDSEHDFGKYFWYKPLQPSLLLHACSCMLNKEYSWNHLQGLMPFGNEGLPCRTPLSMYIASNDEPMHHTFLFWKELSYLMYDNYRT